MKNKQRNSRIRMVLVLAAALSFVLVGTQCAKKAEREVYKIGAIFASTGPASMLGLPEKNTVEMLAEAINADGGIKIRIQSGGGWVDLGIPIEVIMYDTEADPTKTITATKKLIENDQVDIIIGPTTSGTSLAIMDVVSEAQIPLISCAASVRIVEPVSERYWVFKTPQTDVMAVEKIYTKLKADGLKKIAIITVSNGYGDSGRVQLQNLASKYGLEIVADYAF